MMTAAQVIKLPRQSIARIACSACGATAEASCNCGAPYLPAAKRVADASAANPGKSVRTIAKEAGVSVSTAHEELKKSGVRDRTPGKIEGRDGKFYPVHSDRQGLDECSIGGTDSDEHYPDFLNPSEADRGITYIANRVNSGLFAPSPGILQCLKDAMPRASASDREALVTAKELLSQLLEACLSG